VRLLLFVMTSGALVTACWANAGEPPGVYWGGSIRTKADLSTWLSARGVSFESWARRHPGAARELRVPAAPAKRADASTADPLVVGLAVGVGFLILATVLAQTVARSRAAIAVLGLYFLIVNGAYFILITETG